MFSSDNCHHSCHLMSLLTCVCNVQVLLLSTSYHAETLDIAWSYQLPLSEIVLDLSQLAIFSSVGAVY